MDIDIEKIATKYGILKRFTSEIETAFIKSAYDNRLADITAYTNEIIEMCAKECNNIAWSNKNTPMLGPELNALKCEEAIRNLKG